MTFSKILAGYTTYWFMPTRETLTLHPWIVTLSSELLSLKSSVSLIDPNDPAGIILNRIAKLANLIS